ncbi:cyclophilin-like fold protein [Candidatus Latescibacterota bacterium]
MSEKIVITIGTEAVLAELNDSKTSELILAKLPIESDFSTWGDEIYFSIPVQMETENGKEIVELGELGYWSPGNAFCIFYGATPDSTEDEIRPASAVNPLGRILDDPKIFKRLSSASRRIKIEKA